MGQREVARFERSGDVRTVSLIEGEGSLIVREDLSGPSALVAYGDEEHSLRMALSAESAARLLGALDGMGEKPLGDYLAEEGHDIVDLMDLCDANGVPYSFAGIGSESGLQFRPAWEGRRCGPLWS